VKRLLAMTMLALTTIGTAAHAADTERREIADRERWCRYGSLDGQPGHWTETEVRKTIDCALDRWPADRATVYAIAERESGLNARALNTEGSGACGVFQHIGFTPRLQKFNQQVPQGNAGPSCFNGRSNVLVSVRIMSNSGFGPWGG
jgi:hypothetical protein